MTRTHLSIVDRVRAFFQANPFEELTVEDVAAKFSCTRSTAENALSRLSGEGLLQRASVYRVKGPE
jgi:predicted transcriptional regulator